MLQKNNLSSQVLVERVEDNGVLNIRSVELLFDDQKILYLCGGQAASVFLEPGKHFVQAVSPDPYDPNSTNEWRTKVIGFTTKAGDVKRFEICGAGHDSVYTHWQLLDTGNDTSRTMKRFHA